MLITCFFLFFSFLVPMWILFIFKKKVRDTYHIIVLVFIACVKGCLVLFFMISSNHFVCLKMRSNHIIMYLMWNLSMILVRILGIIMYKPFQCPCIMIINHQFIIWKYMGRKIQPSLALCFVIITANWMWNMENKKIQMKII